MITIPIIYDIDDTGAKVNDYASMEKEFRHQMNLLVDEEIRQDNDLSPKAPHFWTCKNDLNPGSRL